MNAAADFHSSGSDMFSQSPPRRIGARMEFPPGQSEAQRGRLIAERLRRVDFTSIRIRAAFGSFAIPARSHDPATADDFGLGEEREAMVSILDRCKVNVEALLYPDPWPEDSGRRPWRPYADELLTALKNEDWKRLDAVYALESIRSNLIIFGESEVYEGIYSVTSCRYEWTLRDDGTWVRDQVREFDDAFEQALSSVSKEAVRGHRLRSARGDLIERLQGHLASRDCPRVRMR